MITILVDEVTNRLKYTLEVILTQWLELEFEIKTELMSLGSDIFLINYSSQEVDADLRFFNSGLLFEHIVRKENPKVENLNKTPVLFGSDPNLSNFDLPFDFFASVFFCLSRYEEYVTLKRDSHGRFQAKNSIFFEHHRIPYLDRWVKQFDDLLVSKGMKLPRESRTQWINTLDMDIAFAYKGRSLQRLLGATAKDMLHLNLKRINERVAVLSGNKADPFDTYHLVINAEVADRKLLFVPAGKRSEFDNNLSLDVKQVQDHVRELSEAMEVGLHPSYQSLGNDHLIAAEKSSLEGIMNTPIQRSRQHFLRFQLPQTYRTLCHHGIREDYSMGFHDAIGFRSGTAYPHTFFDLMNDESIPIQLFPLIAMDSAMKVYLKLQPEEAVSEIGKLISEMKATGGLFVTVWHNHSLSERYEWKGWRAVYLALPELLRTSS